MGLLTNVLIPTGGDENADKISVMPLPQRESSVLFLSCYASTCIRKVYVTFKVYLHTFNAMKLE
jgi:hypothetical protein